MKKHRCHFFHAKGKSSAFSLMEVVVALAIFAVMSIALLQAVNNVQEAFITASESSGKDDTRRFVLRRVMAATNAENIAAGGSIALDNGGAVSWSVSLYSTNIPDLHQIELYLDWDDGESEVLQLWAYRPEWSDPTERSSLLENLRSEYPQTRLSTY